MISANSKHPATGRRMVLQWNLRQVMATAGMFKTTDLVDPLAARGVEISKQMIHKIVTGTPQRINVELLAALCDILDATPNDLLVLGYEQPPTSPSDSATAGIGDLKPVRATIRRPDRS